MASEGAAEATRAAQARSTVRGVLVLQLLANGAGALVVVVYLRLLFPVALPDGGRALGINLTAFTIYLGVTVIVAIPVNAVVLHRNVGWVRAGRDPSWVERLKVLTLPFFETVSAFLAWVGAAVLFGVLNDRGTRVSVGIVLAGLITCSLLYLLLERHFRPVFALALEHATLPPNRREILPRLMLAWLLGSAVPLVALGMAAINVPSDQLAGLGTQVAVATAVSVIAAGLVMRAAATAVALPVEEVRSAMARVEEGDLGVEVRVTNVGELGRLQAGFNAMVAGLREGRQLRDLLGRQIGGQVVEHQLLTGDALGGEAREVSVLFVDLAGFTAFAERHEPTQVITELNRFFAIVVSAVMAEGGMVNKFEGDAALCIFGAPADLPGHQARALRAAVRIPEVVHRQLPSVGVGVGVATGTVVAGHLGTRERFEYTVIGDAVNLAARLADLAKVHPGNALATVTTVTAAGPDASSWCPLGPLTVRGRQAPVEVAELGLPTPVEAEVRSGELRPDG